MKSCHSFHSLGAEKGPMSFPFRHTHPGKVETKSPPPPPPGCVLGGGERKEFWTRDIPILLPHPLPVINDPSLKRGRCHGENSPAGSKKFTKVKIPFCNISMIYTFSSIVPLRIDNSWRSVISNIMAGTMLLTITCNT